MTVLSHQAHVGLLDVQLELQGMLEAIQGPPCSSRSVGAALGNPVSDIVKRDIRMPCIVILVQNI